MLLRLVLCLLDFKSSLGWFAVSTFLLVFMRLKLLVSPPRLLVLLGLLLSEQCGLPRCLLLTLPAILNLLDGLVGIDPAFRIVWARFRTMRRYLAYYPEEEPRIFRMLDLVSRGAQGHGPVHLLLISAAELGFAWNGEEKGWVRVSLPPLRMLSGPVEHFCSSILDAWRFSVFSKLSERTGFLGGEYADFQGCLQLLTSSHLQERDKMLLRAILCGGVWNGFLLGMAKKEDFPCRFCGKRDGDGHLFWECPFPSSSSMSGSFLSLLLSCPSIAATGLAVCFGMVGCLVLMALIIRTLGYFFW